MPTCQSWLPMCSPHHSRSSTVSQRHFSRSSVLDWHVFAVWPGLPPDSRPPQLAHFCLAMMMLITCAGAVAVEHASSNAVGPNAASRRRAARLRLFRARTPRAVSLDGGRRLVADACRGRRRRSGRVLPKACGASLRSGTWSSKALVPPEVFRWRARGLVALVRGGRVAVYGLELKRRMYRDAGTRFSDVSRSTRLPELM